MVIAKTFIMLVNIEIIISNRLYEIIYRTVII